MPMFDKHALRCLSWFDGKGPGGMRVGVAVVPIGEAATSLAPAAALAPGIVVRAALIALEQTLVTIVYK